MLTRLLIRNYALITEEEILFPDGFSVLTGETGAGKTLLVGALGLVLGRRADHSLLFQAEKKCVVEAEFSHLPKRLMKQFKDFAAFDVEGDSILLRREIAPGGTSRAFVNDTPVTLQVMRETASRLVDLHGQHENQLLLSPEHQLGMLDLLSSTVADAEAFGVLLTQLKSVESEWKQLQAQEAEAKRQLDYLSFQLKELRSAQLEPEMESELEKEIKLLENAGTIQEGLSVVVAELYDDESAVYNRLSVLIQRLEKLSSFSENVGTQSAKLREAIELIKDASFELQDLAERISVDPKRLEELFDKQNAWNKLKMRFSVRTVAELLILQSEFEQKVNEFSSIDDRIAALGKKIEALRKDLSKAGLALEEKRQKAIPSLVRKVQSLLKEVGLEQAEFTIELTRQEGEGDATLPIDGKMIRAFSAGINKAEFRIRTNKGTAMGSLSQVASGGEISRVMLALKAALAAKADLEVMVFDEIDNGISGEVANKVGRVMESLSQTVQVIAITHLPQIAGRGSHHFNVSKATESGKTVTHIKKINKAERIFEIARMLSGDPPGKAALKNAEDLLSAK